jgi:hypothetical protein
MKWEEIWEPGAVVVGVLLGLVILAKVVVALWQAHLPLAALGIAISSFLVNCVAVVILVLGFFFIIYAISALMSKTTEHARDTIREIKELKQNHSAEILAISLGAAAEITVFTLSKDFGLEVKGLLALYLLTVIGILHMMISANKRIKIVGRLLLGLISALTASWTVYRYQLYLSSERDKAFGEVVRGSKSLRGADLASLSLMASLLTAILVMTVVSARSREEEH